MIRFLESIPYLEPYANPQYFLYLLLFLLPIVIGIFKGKFKLTLDFDEDKDKPQDAQNQYIVEFNGNWKNYIQTYHFKTHWKNK